MEEEAAPLSAGACRASEASCAAWSNFRATWCSTLPARVKMRSLEHFGAVGSLAGRRGGRERTYVAHAVAADEAAKPVGGMLHPDLAGIHCDDKP